jgi:hypothetical protein
MCLLVLDYLHYSVWASYVGDCFPYGLLRDVWMYHDSPAEVIGAIGLPCENTSIGECLKFVWEAIDHEAILC